MSKLYKGVWVSEHAPHNCEKLTKEQCDSLLRKGGWAIRETTNFDCIPTSNFYAVIKDDFYGFNELTKKVRTKIRKSLRTYEVRKATLNDLLRYGASIYYNAYSKYKVKSTPVSREELEARFRMVCNNNDYDAWIMFRLVDKAPVAWSITHVVEGMCEYETVKVDPAFADSTYPSYGLFYTMNQYYLGDCKLSYVNAGWKSLTQHSNIQQFLIDQFNFRKAYCEMVVHYHPLMNILVSLLYPIRDFLPDSKLKFLLLQESYSRGLGR